MQGQAMLRSVISARELAAVLLIVCIFIFTFTFMNTSMIQMPANIKNDLFLLTI